MIKEKRSKKLGFMEAIKAVNKIKKVSHDRPKKDYGSGLIGEHLIVSSLSTMSMNDLKQLRFLINKMIEEKVIAKRIKYKNDTSSARKTRIRKDTVFNKNCV